MKLVQHLSDLCKEMAMVMPLQDAEGAYTVAFYRLFNIRFLISHNSIVLLTEGLCDAATQENAWASIEEALHKSYGWPGLSTSLSVNDGGELVVQTLINEGCTYDTFFDLTNAHCNFCERLLGEIRRVPDTKVNYHAFITP
ncbi:hypothetical protein [Marinibactrum halimedae]|nr:hypothetical protein [Marinibactrum halimedae]MCD9459086.1 hypothetical protein [Marinibactrum halimedae]